MITSKTFIGIVGLLLLCGCVQQPSEDEYFVTDWGSHFLVDKEKVDTFSMELKTCMEDAIAVCEKCYDELELKTPDGLRDEVVECDNAYYNKIRIRQEPPTFYSYPKSEGDPYEDFWMCAHSFGGAWDLPPDSSTDDVRKSVVECFEYFPPSK